LKVFEAMAMEKPLISTTVGVEGLPVRNGEEVLIADTAESFAESVVRVLKDRALASELSRRAAARVRAEFGWDRVADQFANICSRAYRSDHAHSAVARKSAIKSIG
jgi:glycosyltransferase involved in cell wall biosynthesis